MIRKSLKKLRKQHNETQTKMAERIGVTQRTIANWESGSRNPDLEMLTKISKIYDVTTDYILGLTDDPQREQPATIAARPTAGMAPISEERLQEIIDEAVAAIRAEAAKNDKKPKE